MQLGAHFHLIFKFVRATNQKVQPLLMQLSVQVLFVSNVSTSEVLVSDFIEVRRYWLVSPFGRRFSTVCIGCLALTAHKAYIQGRPLLRQTCECAVALRGAPHASAGRTACTCALESQTRGLRRFACYCEGARWCWHHKFACITVQRARRKVFHISPYVNLWLLSPVAAHRIHIFLCVVRLWGTSWHFPWLLIRNLSKVRTETHITASTFCTMFSSLLACMVYLAVFLVSTLSLLGQFIYCRIANCKRAQLRCYSTETAQS